MSEITTDTINRMFKKFTSMYGNAWTSRHKVDEDIAFSVQLWLKELKRFDLKTLYKAFADCTDSSKDHPPSLPKLVDACWKHVGVPDCTTSLHNCLRKQFNHPVDMMLYEKIGSWALRNDSERTLMKKATNVYHELLSSFKSDPVRFYDKLTQLEQKGFHEEPEGLLTDSEKACFAKPTANVSSATNPNPTVHPVWDKDKVNEYNRNFCENTANERKKYLISLNEQESVSLSPIDYYDRSRYLMQIIANKHLDKVGHIPEVKTGYEQKNKGKNSGKPAKVYKYWMND